MQVNYKVAGKLDLHKMRYLSSNIKMGEISYGIGLECKGVIKMGRGNKIGSE